MFSLIEKIASFGVGLVDKLGYAGVFISMALESAAIPIPSEVVVPFSGFLTLKGRFDFWFLVFLVSLANLFGSIILYYIGKYGGRPTLEKYGKYFLIHIKEFDRAEVWFKKYGSASVFFSRMLPIVRTFISFPAGVFKMSIFKFSILTFAGAVPWNFALAYLGRQFGERWQNLEIYFRRFDIIIIAIILFFVIWFFLKHLRGKHVNISI